MATKAKDGPPGKEKKVTSPSSSNPADRKKTATSSVPNYLKPTMSSRPTSKTGTTVRKPKPHSDDHTAASTTTQKPSLTRRRSFDKPPSPSRVQKALVSPPSRREKATRGSSVSPKPVATSKTPTRVVKSSQIPFSRTKSLKKTTIPAVKKGTSSSSAHASASKAAPTSPDKVDHHQTPCVESEPEDKESMLTEVEDNELVKMECEVELIHPEILISGNKEQADVVEDADEKIDHEDEKVKSCDTTTVLEEQNLPVAPQVEEPQDNKVHNVEETTIEDHHVEEKPKAEENSISVEPEAEVVAKEGEEGVIEIDHNPEEGKTLEKKVVEDGKVKSEEPEESVVVEEAKPPEAEKTVVAKPQAVQGKKEPRASGNDVIEETTTKLMERKNKVRALAGAFETVISLQKPEA